MTFSPLVPDGCPPADAEEAQGEVFRVVKSTVLEPAFFLTHAELGTRANDCPCRRSGLSVFSDLRGALAQQRRYPALGGYIAKAVLDNSHGVVERRTKDTHLTWWTFDGVAPAELFEPLDPGS